MSTDRTTMIKSLRDVLMPELRAAGFSGSLPHVRRLGPTKTDVLSVQFRSGGGSFVLEIAEGPSTTLVTTTGKSLEPDDFTSFEMPLHSRCRLQSVLSKIDVDGWFHFEGNAPTRFADAAERARVFLPQALRHWAGEGPQPNVVRLFGGLAPP